MVIVIHGHKSVEKLIFKQNSRYIGSNIIRLTSNNCILEQKIVQQKGHITGFCLGT